MFGDTKEVCRHYYKLFSETRMVAADEALELESVELLSADGKPATVFKAGEPAKMRFVIGSRIDIDDLAMSMYIKRNDGLVVFDARSDFISRKTFSFRKGERKPVDISFNVNLPTGSYFVGVNIIGPSSAFYMAKDETVGFFVEAPKTLGPAFIDLKW
jgi:hypothetical protein